MGTDDIDLLSVSKLRNACDPTVEIVWPEIGDTPLTCAEIVEAVECGCYEEQPYTSSKNDWDRKRHIERIAYLVVHGWSEPIQIDVGIPTLGYWPGWLVLDGNHRYFAAIVRGDETIEASCSGQVSEINKYRWRSHMSTDVRRARCSSLLAARMWTRHIQYAWRLSFLVGTMHISLHSTHQVACREDHGERPKVGKVPRTASRNSEMRAKAAHKVPDIVVGIENFVEPKRMQHHDLAAVVAKAGEFRAEALSASVVVDELDAAALRIDRENKTLGECRRSRLGFGSASNVHGDLTFGLLPRAELLLQPIVSVFAQINNHWLSTNNQLAFRKRV